MIAESERLGFWTLQGATFPGMVIQGNGDNLLQNVTTNLSWQNNFLSFATFTTSGGLQYEGRDSVDYDHVDWANARISCDP